MRAAYLLWADDNHVERLIKSGVDTLLIPDYNTPPVPIETPEMPSHQRTLDIINKFQGRAEMLIVPIYFQNWFDLPKNQQFISSDGRSWSRTPCPTSAEFFERRFNALSDLYYTGHIDGVVWDLENYAALGVTGFYSEDDMPECHCQRCYKYKDDGADLYEIHRGLWHEYMIDIDIKGMMPYSNPWVVGLFPSDTIWFCEATYEEADYWKLLKISIELGDNPPEASAGVWLEKHSDNNVIDYAESLINDDLPVNFSRYWFYTHSRLTDESKPCPGPYCGPMKNIFYEDLKKVSGGEQMGCKYWGEIDTIMQRCKADIAEVCGNCDCEHEQPEDCYPEYEGQGDHPDYPNDMPTSGERFDHDWYLGTNEDIAESECFHDKPYAHYYHFGKDEGRKPYRPDPDKFRVLNPSSVAVKLIDGGDNGVVTVADNGDVYMAEGDVFVGPTKYETAIFVCRMGDNPMVKSNWEFVKGTSGKTYGLLWFKGMLLSLQSDSGSGFEGTQNCRVWDVFSGWRSNNTLQSIINGRGVNWFFVNKGPGYQHSYQPDTVDIGCMQYANVGDRDFKTPVLLYRGDPHRLQTFELIGPAVGLDGPRNNYTTTCSITYFDWTKQYVSVLGDWAKSVNYQFVTQQDNVRGPYFTAKSDVFVPPMIRHEISEAPSGYSGAFTGNFFERGGIIYEVISGHRHKDDDNTWIRSVIGQ